MGIKNGPDKLGGEPFARAGESMYQHDIRYLHDVKGMWYHSGIMKPKIHLRGLLSPRFANSFYRIYGINTLEELYNFCLDFEYGPHNALHWFRNVGKVGWQQIFDALEDNGYDTSIFDRRGTIPTRGNIDRQIGKLIDLLQEYRQLET